jgi:outer membrane receptor protein involved in Fe transport
MEKTCTNRSFYIIMAMLLSGTAFIITTPARAVESPDDKKPAEPIEVLQNFVVSAEKREGTVQNTPISMTVDSGENLMARGIADLGALAVETPGLSIKNEGGNGETELEMRGMTSAGGSAPTVGFYIDDVPITSPANAQNGKVVLLPPLYDTNRIEVLRGPQGTLYGSGSMGGTVKLMFNEPDLTGLHASVQSILSGTEGGGFNHSDNLMLNLPLVQDKLAVRFVATEAHTSGWIPRIVENPFPLVSTDGSTRGNVLAAPVSARYDQSNAEQYDSVRGGVVWKATDRLKLSADLLYLHESQDGYSAFDSSPGTLARYEPFDVKEPKSEQSKITSISANYTGDSVDVSWINSYWTHRSTLIQAAAEELNNPNTGATYAANNGLPNPGYYGPNGSGEMIGREHNINEQYSSELRVASKDKGNLTWVTGAYFSHFWGTWRFAGNVSNPYAYADIATLQHATSNLWVGSYAPTSIEQYALFGNASYALTSNLKASVGLRFNRYDYTFSSFTDGFGSALGNATPSYTGIVNQSETVALPKFNLNYIVNRDVSIYGTVSEGYRPGGGNNAYPTTGPIWGPAFAAYSYPNNRWPVTYKSDSVWSYELGTKSRWLNHRLQVNASVYFEDWNHIQLQSEPGNWAVNTNGNSAKIFGGDIDARAVLGGGFVAGAAIGLTHVHLDPGPNWVFAPNNVLPDVAPINGNVDLTHTATVFKKYTLTTHVETSYVAARYSMGFLYPYVSNGEFNGLPAYSLTNFRIGLESGGGNGGIWSVAFFANNIFNKHAQLENLFQLTQSSAAFNRVVTNQPRTAGVDLTYRF